MILVSLGVLIIVCIFAGVFTAIAKVEGWRAALGIMASAFGVTALFAVAMTLIALGMK